MIIDIKLFNDRRIDYLEKIIGKTLENEATILKFYLTEEMKEKDFYLEFETPNGEKYSTLALPINEEEMTVEYIVPNSLLSDAGELKTEIVLRKEKEVFKTFNLMFNILESINATEDIPEKFPDVITELFEEVAINSKNIKANKEKIEENAENISQLNGSVSDLVDEVNEHEQDIENLQINKANQGYVELIENDVKLLKEAKADKTEIPDVSDLASKESVEDLQNQVNNVNETISEIDRELNNAQNDIETLQQEMTEVEENQNYLEENKADRSEIPDVSEFIKKTVDDLVNYYKKSETYTQTEVNQLIGAIKTISMKVLPERPETGQENIIYLIPSKSSKTENIYEEWIYVNNKWELIGSTQVDLSNYYTKDEINTLLYDYITSNDLEDILENYALKSDIPEETKIDNTTITKNNNNEIQSIGNILQNGDSYQKYWKGTKNEFNAIQEKDNNTLYEVVDDEETALFEVDGTTIEFSDDELLRIPNNIDLMYQSVLYGNGESGYRKYRNGMLEQWGVATTQANETEFNMHQSHKDTNFSIFIEPREMGNFFHYAIPSANQKFKCRIQSRDNVSMAVTFQWRSWGRWK